LGGPAGGLSQAVHQAVSKKRPKNDPIYQIMINFV
jgi:hypothetical protein